MGSRGRPWAAVAANRTSHGCPRVPMGIKLGCRGRPWERQRAPTGVRVMPWARPRAITQNHDHAHHPSPGRVKSDSRTQHQLLTPTWGVLRNPPAGAGQGGRRDQPQAIADPSVFLAAGLPPKPLPVEHYVKPDVKNAWRQPVSLKIQRPKLPMCKAS